MGPRPPRSRFTFGHPRPRAQNPNGTQTNIYPSNQQIVQEPGVDSKSVGAGGLNSRSRLYQSAARSRFSPTDTGAVRSGSSRKSFPTPSGGTTRKRLDSKVDSSRWSGYPGTTAAPHHEAGLVPGNIRWEHLIKTPPRSGKYQLHYIYQGTPNALVLVRFNDQEVLLKPRSAKRANIRISVLDDQDEDSPCGTAVYVPQQPLEHRHVEHDSTKGYAKACLLTPGLAKGSKHQAGSADGRGSLDFYPAHHHGFGKGPQSPAAMYSGGFNTPGERYAQATRGSPQILIQGKYKPFQTIRPSGDVILDLAATTAMPPSPSQYTPTTAPLPQSVRILERWFQRTPRPPSTEDEHATTPSTEEEHATTPSTEEGHATTPSTEEEHATTPSTEEEHATTPSTEEEHATTPSTEEEHATTPSTEDEHATTPSTEEEHATTPSTEEGHATTPSTEEEYATTPSTEEGHATTPSTEEEYATTPSTEEEYATTPSAEEEYATTPSTEDENAMAASLSTGTTHQREGNDAVTVSLDYDQFNVDPITAPPQGGHMQSLLNGDDHATVTPSPHWNITGALPLASPMLMLDPTRAFH